MLNLSEAFGWVVPTVSVGPGNAVFSLMTARSWWLLLPRSATALIAEIVSPFAGLGRPALLPPAGQLFAASGCHTSPSFFSRSTSPRTQCEAVSTQSSSTSAPVQYQYSLLGSFSSSFAVFLSRMITLPLRSVTSVPLKMRSTCSAVESGAHEVATASRPAIVSSRWRCVVVIVACIWPATGPGRSRKRAFSCVFHQLAGRDGSPGQPPLRGKRDSP